MASTPFNKAFLGPSDLALAKRVLNRICSEQGIDAGGREANELAAILIRQLQRGTCDEETLIALFGLSRHPRPRNMPQRRELSDRASR